MSELVNVERPTVSTEIKASIKERLPKLCSAMAKLALSRLEARGLESPSCYEVGLSNTGFSARYHDPYMPHSANYKTFKKEHLESARKESEAGGLTTESDRDWLHVLETYNALSDEEKVGGFAVANFVISYGSTRFGKWTLENISAMREYDVKSASGIGIAEVDADGIKLYPGYEGTMDLETLHRTIEIFENAKEEDIQVTLPVTI